MCAALPLVAVEAVVMDVIRLVQPRRNPVRHPEDLAMQVGMDMLPVRPVLAVEAELVVPESPLPGIQVVLVVLDIPQISPECRRVMAAVEAVALKAERLAAQPLAAVVPVVLVLLHQPQGHQIPAVVAEVLRNIPPM
jgi:hypothetical protein